MVITVSKRLFVWSCVMKENPREYRGIFKVEKYDNCSRFRKSCLKMRTYLSSQVRTYLSSQKTWRGRVYVGENVRLLACHFRNKCCMDTSRYSVKVKFIIKCKIQKNWCTVTVAPTPPRWTFTHPCKPEVRPGAREESHICCYGWWVGK